MGLGHDVLSADIIFPASHPVFSSEFSWLPSVHGISADTTYSILSATMYLIIAIVLWSLLQASGRRRMWHRAVFMRLGGVEGLVNILSHNCRASSSTLSGRDSATATGDATANLLSAGITRTAAVALAHITSASDVVKEGAVGMGAVDQLVEYIATTTIAGAGIGGPGAFEDGQARESVSQALSELLVRRLGFSFSLVMQSVLDLLRFLRLCMVVMSYCTNISLFSWIDSKLCRAGRTPLLSFFRSLKVFRAPTRRGS